MEANVNVTFAVIGAARHDASSSTELRSDAIVVHQSATTERGTRARTHGPRVQCVCEGSLTMIAQALIAPTNKISTHTQLEGKQKV